MPITPKFKITQNDEAVVLRINIPHVRITNLEIVADGTDFSFYCKPYLLKLKLPHDVDGKSEQCKGVYDPDTEDGIVTVTLPKSTPGLHFPHLDLLTTLLHTPISSTASVAKGPLIEELSCSGTGVSDEEGKIVVDEGEEETRKKDSGSVAIEEENNGIHMSTSLARYKYGFLNMYSGIFSPLHELVSDVLQVSDPDGTTPQERRRARLEREVSDFDPERYLGDHFGAEEDPLFQEASRFVPFWSSTSSSSSAILPVATTATQSATQSASDNNNEVTKSSAENNSAEQEDMSNIEFTDEETDVMMNRLRNREYPSLTAGSSQESSVLLGLSDLLFAYCYELRITLGDFTVESAANVTRLSALLSWMDTYEAGTPLSAVIQSNLRRSFVYPYLRCWTYSKLVLSDVVHILTRGKRCILKALLQMKLLLDRTQSHYLLSKVLLDDYCVWIQRVSEERLSAFARTYNDHAQSLLNTTSSMPSALDTLGLNLSRLTRWADEQIQSGECPEVPAFLYPETSVRAIATLVSGMKPVTVTTASVLEATTSGVLGISDLLSHIKLSK